MPSTRPATSASLSSPPAAARGLDRDHVPFRELAGELPGCRLAVDEVPAARPGRAAPLPGRCVRAPLADDREPAVLEHAELPHDAVAAAVLAIATRAEAERVALDPERVLQLERLDRRRERVRHRHVHPARPICARTGALPAADRLVVRKALVPERDVVHRPLPLRRAVYRLPERAHDA